MDLVSHIPGIGPTKTFSPGSTTQSPLNTSHVGLTDGTSSANASKNMAEIYNRLLLQVTSVIVKSGLTVDTQDWAQLGKAVETIALANAGSGGGGGSTQAQLLATLTGAITNSQLSAALATRISLIDSPASVVGSVAWQVAQEASTRGTAIASETTARQLADSNIITTVNSMAATVNSNTAQISQESNARATADSSLALRVSTLEATGGGGSSGGVTQAQLQTEQTVRANADSALSQDVTTLSTSVSGVRNSIEQEILTRSSQTGNLFSKYTVKIDQNGYVSGFGLASEANNGTPVSSFIIRADNFAIGSPTGPGISPKMPFIVQTTPTTVDGVSVPAGVYIDQATIANASVGTLKIGKNAVTVPVIASTYGRYFYPSNYLGDGFLGTVVDTSINTEGNPCWLIATIDIDATILNAYNNSARKPFVTISADGAYAFRTTIGTGGIRETLVLSYYHAAPTAGTHTYSLKIGFDGAPGDPGNFYIYYADLFAIGVKR